jgi:hypothetical protein
LKHAADHNYTRFMILNPLCVTEFSLFPKKQQFLNGKAKGSVFEIGALRDFFIKEFILLLSMVTRFEPRGCWLVTSR